MVATEILHTDGVVLNKPFCTNPGILSVFEMFVFSDLSAIAISCYVGINSFGKKACTLLLSSFGLRGELSYMSFFCSCSRR